MKTSRDYLIHRILRAALRVRECRYRVVAVGIDHKGRIINLQVNKPRLRTRGYHAEELLIYKSPRSLSKILLARVGSRGDFLPIDPCVKCQRLIDKRGLRVEMVR